ncbi:g2444 [Coccomyxa elongata]
MSGSPYKRPKFVSPHGAPTPGVSPSPPGMDVVPHVPDKKHDLLEFFADRNERARSQDEKIRGLQSACEALEGQLRRAQATIDSQKAEILSEKSQREALEGRLKYEKELLEDVLHREMERTSALQAELQQAQQAKRDADLGREKAEADRAEADSNAKRTKQGLERKIIKLEGQLAHAASQLDERGQHLMAELRQARLQADLSARLQRELEAQLEEAVTLAEQATQKRREAETQLAAAEAGAEAAARHGALSRTVEGRDEELRILRDELAAQEDAVREARRLTEHVRKSGVLAEQLAAAEAKIRRLELVAAAHSELQAQVEPLQGELRLWRSALTGAAGSGGSTGPEAVLQLLENLRGQVLSLTEHAGEKEAEARRLQEALRAAEDAAKEADARLMRTQAAQSEAAGALARTERKVALLTKERDGLKSILASYDEEDGAAGTGPRGAQAEHVRELEATNAALNAQLKVLEEEAAQQVASLRMQTENLAAATERADKAESQVRQLEAEADAQGRQIALLEERLGRGEFNPATTRVLHFVHNPEAEACREAEAAQLTSLQAEAAALRAQLAVLSSASGGASDPSAPAAAVAAAEKTLLERKVSELEKRESRLKEVFKKQVSNFREACFCLFGYRVDMASQATQSGGPPPTTFVLKPQHADDPHAQLLFKMDPDGGMALLPNEFTTKHLDREVETFITRFKSIPAFTANLTMEMFQKQTQS